MPDPPGRGYAWGMLAAVAARRWVFPQPPDSAAVQRLCQELRLPPVLCRLMAQRGMQEPDAARGFLRPHAGQLHPPALLAGMGDAVARLRRALDTQETVLVHGEY